jgi:hypothetical protein
MEMSLHPVMAVSVQYCSDAVPDEALARAGYRILSFSPRPASPLRPGRLNFGFDISDPN